MNAKEEIRIHAERIFRPFLHGHLDVVRMGQVDFHVVIEEQFLVHGLCRNHVHALFLVTVLCRAEIVSPVSGVNDDDQLFAGVLQSFHFLSFRCLPALDKCPRE